MNNFLKDDYEIYCSHCGAVIEANESKYDFTNYIQEYFNRRTIKPENLPEDYLFLINKNDIDSLFDDAKMGVEAVFDIEGDSEEVTQNNEEKTESILGATNETFNVDNSVSQRTTLVKSFNKYIFNKASVGKYEEGIEYCEEVSYTKKIEIPLQIDGGKLSAGKNKIMEIFVKRCPRCLRELNNELGKYEMINIGLIGSPGSGKTSMIIALSYFLQQNFDPYNLGIDNIMILPEITYNINNEQEYNDIGKKFNQYRKSYENGFAVEKTEESMENIININIKIESKKQTKIVNFIDLPGELWNNDKDDNAVKLDTSKIHDQRPVIKKCHKFIICLASHDLNNELGNNDYAKNVYNYLKEKKECYENAYACCCIINKFDNLSNRQEKIENIFKHLSAEIMRNASYLNDKKELFLNNGSYTNLEIITRELFFKLAGNNNSIGKIEDMKFFPMSPYGFPPETEKDGAESSSNRNPEPWYLEVLLIWILHKFGFIDAVNNNLA